MAVDYVGPSKLRRIFEDEYQRIAHDYDRQGSPRVVINFPHDTLAVAASSILCGNYWFSQEEVDTYVNRQIAKLEKILFCRNEKYAKKKWSEIMGGLTRMRFDKQDIIGASAAYMPYADAMFFDPYYTTMFRFLREPVKKRTPTDIPAIFQHELVHWDCGETLPCMEIRKNSQEFSEFLSYVSEWAAALKIGPRAVENWARKEGRVEFLKRLENENQNLTEGAKSIVGKEMTRVLSVRSIIEELNMGIAEEALAYNHGGGKCMFMEWLSEKHGEKAARGMQMYEILAAKIAAQGKLVTFREVKQAIDASYSEGRDFFSFFL